MDVVAGQQAALLKVDEAARLLRIGRSKAYAMVATGTMPGVVRVGSQIRVSARALNDWIDQQASAA